MESLLYLDGAALCHWRGSGLHGSAFLSCWSLSFSGVRTTSNPCPIPSVPGTERVFGESTLNHMEDELQEKTEPFFPCRPSSSAQLPGSYQPARGQHACECAGLTPEPDCAMGCQVRGHNWAAGEAGQSRHAHHDMPGAHLLSLRRYGPRLNHPPARPCSGLGGCSHHL